jgi:hypothetical protein
MEKNIKIKTELHKIKPYNIIQKKYIHDNNKLNKFFDIYFKNKMSISTYEELINK